MRRHDTAGSHGRLRGYVGISLKDKTDLDTESLDSLPARIAAALAERIIRGTLKPGDRVRQDSVASEFNTSHAPVREAFRRLEARGLLASRERRGSYVPPLDLASVLEITRMRAALEVLALTHAIPNLTEHDIASAENAIEQAHSCRDISTWEEANRRFHRSLYLPCRMDRLLAAIEDLHEARLRYMYATASQIDWNAKSEDEHQAIIVAIKSRDIESACRLLKQHIDDSGQILVAAVRSSCS